MAEMIQQSVTTIKTNQETEKTENNIGSEEKAALFRRQLKLESSTASNIVRGKLLQLITLEDE